MYLLVDKQVELVFLYSLGWFFSNCPRLTELHRDENKLSMKSNDGRLQSLHSPIYLQWEKTETKSFKRMTSDKQKRKYVRAVYKRYSVQQVNDKTLLTRVV